MSTVAESVPPLVAGDRLSREEFLRIWEDHPEIKRAELIGGIVYLPSPLSFDHGATESDVGIWAGTYRVRTPGTKTCHSATTFLLDDAPQPDVNLLIEAECGGQSHREGIFIGGSPEWLAEISLSSKAYDLLQKLDLYQEAGIQEYLAVLLYEREIRWHVLDKGVYRLMPPDGDGIWRSRVFPGLWLDGAAFLAGDMVKVMAKLDEGLATPEHKAFVAKLAAARRGP